MTTGERIKKVRKEQNITQRELAQKMGLSPQTVAQWENNLRNPKYETIRKIAEALDVTIPFLISGDTEEEIKKALTLHDFNRLSKLLHLPENAEDSEIEKAAVTHIDSIRKMRKSRRNIQSITARLGNSIVTDEEVPYYADWLDFLKKVAHKGKNDYLDFPGISDGYSFSAIEVALISYFSALNSMGQQKALEYARDLSRISEYQKSPSEAQEEAKPSENGTTPENKKNPSEGQ